MNNSSFDFSNVFRPIFASDTNPQNSTNNSAMSSTRTNIIVPMVNAFMYLTAMSFCFIFILLLYQVRPFHRNLSILLGNMAVSFLILGVTDTCLSVADNANVTYSGYFCFITNTGWYDSCFIISLTPFMIVIERAVATYKAKTYETTNSAKFGIVLVITQWSFAFGMSAAQQIFEPAIYGNCDDKGAIEGDVLLISLYFIVTCNFIGIPAFITLMRVNKKQYAATFGKQSHSLSQRYQLAENIKATRFIMPIAAINSICALFGVILAIVTFSLENPPQWINDMLNLVFESLLPLYGVMYPWVCAYGHPALRKQIKRKYFFCCKSASVSPTECELRNPNGKSLIFDAEKEADLHFAGLNADWN